MYVLGLQKEGGIQLSGINSEWDSSQIQSMFHVLETLDLKQKTFKGTFCQEIKKLCWFWEHENECIYKYQIGKETIKSQYNFVNKIQMAVLGFLNRDQLFEMMASLSRYYLNFTDSKHSRTFPQF